MSAYPLLEYLRTEELPHTMCPGCGGGTVLNTFARAIDDMGVPREDLVLVSGIGCSAWIPSPNFEADTLHTTHGRAIAYATGVAVGNPDLETVVISGDGDLAGIGGNHLLHAARRNVDLTVILVNNFTYGMTGGQVAPTTPHDSITTTSPFGNPEDAIDISGVAAEAGAAFVARQTTSRPQALVNDITRAMQTDGFALLEVFSQCPTVYGRRNEMATAPEMLDWMESQIDAGELTVGTIADTDRPEFIESLEAVSERARSEQTTVEDPAPDHDGRDLMLRIAGEGGQGVETAGSILGEAAARNGRNVFKTEEYGSRARGGLASADLILSDGEIFEATVPSGDADLLVALTPSALQAHQSVLKSGGDLVVDETTLETVPSEATAVPFERLAEEAGDARALNMVVLGYLTAAFDLADVGTVRGTIDRHVDRLLATNRAAFDLGVEAADSA